MTLLPAMSTNDPFKPKRAAFRLRDWSAWLLCFSFFFMVPMEFSMLEWEKTSEGLWRIQRAEELGPWVGIQFLLWAFVTFVSSLFFIMTGLLQGFCYEKTVFRKRVEGLELVYYFAWVQFFTWVTLLLHLFISGTSEWLDSMMVFLPHFIMLGAALVLYRGSWSALGLGHNSVKRWLLIIGVVAGAYLFVFRFLDSFVTEPVAQWFHLELQSWREDDISAGISQAIDSGWGWFFLQLFIIGIVGPIAEEVVFRGVIMQVLLRQVGAVLSVVLSSLIFALFHADVVFFAPLFVMGLVMGSLYAWFRTLWAPILFHIVNNSVSVLLEVFHP